MPQSAARMMNGKSRTAAYTRVASAQYLAKWRSVPESLKTVRTVRNVTIKGSSSLAQISDRRDMSEADDQRSGSELKNKALDHKSL